jgi:hypothetical protein
MSLPGPSNSRAQLSLALQSSLLGSPTHGIHCTGFLFPSPSGPPSPNLVVSTKKHTHTLAHTWVPEDLNPGPPRALCRSPQPAVTGAALAQSLPLESHSCSGSRPRTHPRPRPPLPGACSSSSGPRRCPSWTRGDASPQRPHVPWLGLWGVQTASRHLVSLTAAEYPPAPPTSPNPCEARGK